MASRRIAIVISVSGSARSQQAIKGVSTSSKQLDNVLKQVSGGFNRLNASMRRMEPQARKLSHLQSGLTNSFIRGNLAARAISFGIMSVQRALAAGFISAVEFEWSMAKIEGIVQPTAAELESLSNKIRSVAAVSPRTAAEVANAALAMSKLGLSAEETAAALEGVVAMSVAMDEDVKRVGETIVSVKNVFGLAADDLNRISNELFATLSKSALDLDKFSTAFSFAGGAAKVAGVSFEELSGIMGALADSGIKASTIGTQTRSVLIDLSDASSKASKLIGGETIATIGLAAALQRVKDAELGAGEIKRIFGKRTVSVVAALTNNIDKVLELEQAQRDANRELEKANEIMNRTTKGSAKRLASAWTDLWIAITKTTDLPVATVLSAWADGFDLMSIAIDTFFERDVDPERLKRFFGSGFTVPEQKGLPERVTKTEEEYSKDAEAQYEQRINKIKEATEENVKMLRVQFEQLKVGQQLNELLGMSGDLTKVSDSYEKIADALMDVGAEKEAIIVLKEMERLRKIIDQPNVDALKRMQEEDAAYNKWLNNATEKAQTLLNEKNIVHELTERWGDLWSAQILVADSIDILDAGINAITMDISRVIVGLEKWRDLGDILVNTFQRVGAAIIAELTRIIVKTLILRAVTALLPGVGAAGVPIISEFFAPKARGFSGMVNKPTAMVFGESGPEHVQITPRAKSARGSSGGATLNLNYYGNVYNKEDSMNFVNEALEQLERRTSSV